MNCECIDVRFNMLTAHRLFIMTFGSEKKNYSEGKEKLRFLSVSHSYSFLHNIGGISSMLKQAWHWIRFARYFIAFHLLMKYWWMTDEKKKHWGTILYISFHQFIKIQREKIINSLTSGGWQCRTVRLSYSRHMQVRWETPPSDRWCRIVNLARGAISLRSKATSSMTSSPAQLFSVPCDPSWHADSRTGWGCRWSRNKRYPRAWSPLCRAAARQAPAPHGCDWHGWLWCHV